MSAWIATRTLTANDGHTVQVSLGAPEQYQGIWRCAVRFDFDNGAAADSYGHGVDAFQALQNGLECIYVGVKAEERTLSWLSPGDAGFARSMPLGLGLTFRRRVEGLVDGAIEAYVEGLKAP